MRFTKAELRNIEKNIEYWGERAGQKVLEYQKGTDIYIYKINEAYNKAINDINKDINKIYFNYVKAHKLDPKEALELLERKLNYKEVRDIVKDLYSINDEEVKAYKIAEYEAMAYKDRITRLELIKEQIKQRTKEATPTQEQLMSESLKKSYAESYYKKTYEIQTQAMIYETFSKIPDLQLEKAISQKWLKSNYSERIWKNNTKLGNNIAEEIGDLLQRATITGRANKKVAKEIADKFEVGKYEAERLVRTETSYITNQAELQCYKESETEEVIFLATLDKKTSKVCQSWDNKVLKVSELKVGYNYPPLHPHCRSFTIAKTEDRPAKRIARDKNGKNMYISSEINYQEWYNTFII